MAHDTPETNQNCACSIPDSFEPKGQSCFHGNPQGTMEVGEVEGQTVVVKEGTDQQLVLHNADSRDALGVPSPLHSCPVLSPLVGVLGRKGGSPKGKAVL